MDDQAVNLPIDRAVHDDPELEAGRQNVTPSAIAEQAIRDCLHFYAAEREILRQRVVEADKGKFISSEAMLRWMESWGTDRELPPPEPDLDFGPRRK